MLSGDLPEVPHVCELFDTDVVEHMRAGGEVTVERAVATFATLERNLARVRILTLREPFPADEAGFARFVIKIHRAFLQGTGLYSGGGRFREGPITFGPASHLRHGVAADRIGAELGRLARRCLPAEPCALSRAVLLTAGARLVHGFLHVHPFPDVNGRTARALFGALVTASGRYARPLPREDDRRAHAEYVDALQRVDWALDAEEHAHDEHFTPLARWLGRYVEEPEPEPEGPA